MEKKPKQANFIEILLFVLVIICATMILVELFTNVSNELQSSLHSLIQVSK